MASPRLAWPPERLRRVTTSSNTAQGSRGWLARLLTEIPSLAIEAVKEPPLRRGTRAVGPTDANRRLIRSTTSAASMPAVLTTGGGTGTYVATTGRSLG